MCVSVFAVRKVTREREREREIEEAGFLIQSRERRQVGYKRQKRIIHADTTPTPPPPLPAAAPAQAAATIPLISEARTPALQARATSLEWRRAYCDDEEEGLHPGESVKASTPARRQSKSSTTGSGRFSSDDLLLFRSSGVSRSAWTRRDSSTSSEIPWSSESSSARRRETSEGAEEKAVVFS